VLSAEWVPKVCDLGIGVLSEKDFKARIGKCGTPRYMAPECVNDGPVANLQAVDSYGFGWIAHDVAHIGTPPDAQRSADGAVPSASSGGSGSEPTGNKVSSTPPADTLSASGSTPWIGVLVRRSMSKFSVEMGEHVPAPLAQLIGACLAVDPALRPTLAAARERLAQAAPEAPGWGLTPM
jgi:serine/threonine protein kinase